MGGSGITQNGDITTAEKLKELARKKLLEGKICDVFIPHAWDYSDDYERIKSFLDEDESLCYRDYSIPSEAPLDVKSKKELEEALENQIRSVSVVIVPAGMYAAHREWIEKEIEIAKKYDKPIVAVSPWGSERIPTIVSENADEIVGWSGSSIRDAIKRVMR